MVATKRLDQAGWDEKQQKIADDSVTEAKSPQEGDGGTTRSAPLGIVSYGSASLLNTNHGGRSTLCGPYVVTLLDWTHIFEWYVTRLVVENNHEKGHML